MSHVPPAKKAPEPAPAGNHVARLYQIAHIGTVPTVYMGEQQLTDQVRLTFELCNKRKVFKEGEPEKPLSISTFFLTYSMGKKANLTKLVEGMIGTTLDEEEAAMFDLDGILGEACLLNVVHTEKAGSTYANIKSASPLPEGITAPPIFNKPVFLDVNTMTLEDIEAQPDFIKDRMKSSEEFDKRFRQPDTSAAEVSGSPF